MRRIFLTLFAIWIGGFTHAQGSSEVPLQHGDVLKFRILGNKDLSDIYVIEADGSFSVPGLGQVSGFKTISDARTMMAALVENQLGVGSDTFVLSVESYRPVTIGGDVANPGAVQFIPDLNVITAISLAGGTRRSTSETLGQSILINQERERLAQSEIQLAGYLMQNTRLTAKLRDQPFETIPQDVIALVGLEEAERLFAMEREIAQELAQNEDLARQRIASTQSINAADVSSKKAIATSLKTQLDLVRLDLERLQPAIENGSVTGARVLSLRRDFVDVEGLVGQAVGGLNQSLTEQAILAEESDVLDLQLRIDTLSQLSALHQSIAAVVTSIDALSETLELANAQPIVTNSRTRDGDCQILLLRPNADGTQTVTEVDALTILQPRDHLEVGRQSSRCPPLISLSRVRN